MPNYKTIELTQGQITKVDADLYTWLSQWNWCAKYNPDYESYYAVRTSSAIGGAKRFLIPMHRQILGLDSREKVHVDHRNRDSLDNRRENLRTATHAQNQWNQKLSKRNKTGFRGVRKQKRGSKFEATCRKIYLGTFNTAEEAYEAYKIKAIELYGDYAGVD